MTMADEQFPNFWVIRVGRKLQGLCGSLDIIPRCSTIDNLREEWNGVGHRTNLVRTETRGKREYIGVVPNLGR